MLTYCPDCRKKIAETARVCPNCGRQCDPKELAEQGLRERAWRKKVAIVLIAMFVVFVLVKMIAKGQQEPRYVLVSEGVWPDSFKPRPVQIYFDRDSFRRNGDVISATVKLAFPSGPGTAFEKTTLAGLPVYSILAPVRFDCAKNKIYADGRKAQVFDEQGAKLVLRKPVKEILAQPSKDRAMYHLWEYVCERASSTPTGPPQLKPKP